MTTTKPEPNDDLLLVDDTSAAEETLTSRAWTVLVVDDDPEVHNATNFALQDILVDGRPLHIIHARSGSEALEVIRNNDDIAVAILDVVMENERSGLDLVRAIRRDLNRGAMRIVLRTGQPGYAPEMRVIREYDINDYKTKSELTRVRLLTTLTTALRSYDQLHTIMASQRRLAMIVDSASTIFASTSLAEFAATALRTATDLVGTGCPGTFWYRESTSAPAVPLAGIGADGLPVADLSALALPAAVVKCFADRQPVAGEMHETLFIAGEQGNDAVLALAPAHLLDLPTRQLLAVFCVTLGTGLRNAGLISRLRFSAYTDPITRLANRAGFVAGLERRLQTGDTDWSVALIDIDHFSELNDALGHQKGDQLLIAVGERLKTLLGPDMLLARVGGDVFGLLAPTALVTPEHLLDLFKAPFAVGEYSLPVQATLGLARLADAEGRAIDLLKATTIALNRAKSGNRGRWHYYTEDMAAATRSRLELLHDLRLAVAEKHGLEVHYQPQIEFSTGRVVGAEALIRWRTSDGNYIRPDQFIPLAEYAGLINEIGAWVFATAVRQLRAWEEAGLQLRMAVNVSLVQFRDPLFLEHGRQALAACGVAPDRIELEITESVAMLEEDNVIAILNELKSMGIRLAIDDFGTGFSSLSYLHRLPIDRMKIDRSFVRDLHSTQGSGASIAETIIRLGQSLGLEIIAEGVETEAQAQLLKHLGCPLAQGFLYSRPLPAADFEAWARSRSTPT